MLRPFGFQLSEAKTTPLFNGYKSQCFCPLSSFLSKFLNFIIQLAFTIYNSTFSFCIFISMFQFLYFEFSSFLFSSFIPDSNLLVLNFDPIILTCNSNNFNQKFLWLTPPPLGMQKFKILQFNTHFRYRILRASLSYSHEDGAAFHFHNLCKSRCGLAYKL